MAMTVIPAYGRDYKSKKDALADWNADKDFKIQGIKHHGKAINKSDAERFDAGPIKIRYNKLQRVVMVNE